MSVKGGPYRVMVVDDSAIIRGFLCRYLSEDADIEVVTTANNGAVALRQLQAHNIEVVVLDIEMPEMDGLTALPRMIELIPDLQVVMASTLTRKNAEVSLRAMQMGAVDYVPKPETARSVNASIDFRRELVDKVKAWASRRRKKRGEDLPTGANDPGAPGGGSTAAGLAARTVTVQRPGAAAGASAGFVTARRPAPPVAVTPTRRAEAPAPLADGNAIKLRTGSFRRPKILAIGSSTGGPQALMKFFKGFKQAPQVPVLITQHMPATFTAILAEHLGQSTGWKTQEARDGQLLMPGEMYVAPGGRHMEVDMVDGKAQVRLTDEPPENFCRPAVDPLFRSLAKAYGENVLAIILTGMGHDGLKGARELTRTGGTLLAQDEASSVVWGMPGAVATAGLCTEVLPVDKLGEAAAVRLQGGIR
ncbi:protein-glutamate methylesterase/protein-glutamine glutaminase [Kordiimonas sp.]|uniref:protein-glutamate methylesterase/protein-glutamine glutaminase n=1 Tax=Kordiimonas sp. TaxID=1970157 RepID=UPI003A91851C